MDADPDLIDVAEYRRSDFEEEAAVLWESLDQESKREFFTDYVSHLANFSRDVVKDPWMANVLSDAITFSELYGTWKMYICPEPDCLRLFPNDESLIIHLKCKHLPEIHPVAWPPRGHNLAFERLCADAFRKMVWKPIVVEAALDMLSSMCLYNQHVTMIDLCSGSDQLYSLNWLYSDNPERKNLLAVLEGKFRILLDHHDRASFSLLSNGYLTTIIALASKHIFVGRPRRHNEKFLQELLARSPFSFCLLKAADLNRFVQLVEPMCQFVQQAANRESDSIDGDVKRKGEILDRLSFSTKDDFIRFFEVETYRDGERESIISFLCRGPCNPIIQRVPCKAYESYSIVKHVLDELRDPLKVDCTGSSFQSKQNHLELVNRVQCLEYQLRQLCAFDFHVNILPLIRSFLRMKLYFYLKWHRCKAREEDPAVLCPKASYQDGYIEQKACSEESGSEHDSDNEKQEECISDCNFDLDYKPWRDSPTLSRLDSTLSESKTGGTEGNGPFFWLAISDLTSDMLTYNSDAWKKAVEGYKQFRVNKTWRFWVCHICGDRTFIDCESHMVHLENWHELSIGNDDYWLIPQQNIGDEGGVFRQDVLSSEIRWVDYITIDHTYNYFLVDSSELDEMPPPEYGELLYQKENDRCGVIVDRLKDLLCKLKCFCQFKMQKLQYLGVVNSMGLMLFNGGQPLSILMSWLHKFSTVDSSVGTTFKLQFIFLSKLLDQAHAPGYGPLNNSSVQEAFKTIEQEATYLLHRTDREILKTVNEIDNMKCHLSYLSERDYRMNFVPYVRSFVLDKFNFDDISSLECNNVKKFLSTPDILVDRGKAHFFRLSVLSPGKVVINTRKKSSWAFAFMGIHFSFAGEWSFTGKRELTGVFTFGGWSTWDSQTYGGYGSVVLDDLAVLESTYWHRLDHILCDAVSQKLLSFTYGMQIGLHNVENEDETELLR